MLDFYHVCEYLSEAANGIESQAAAQQVWLSKQKDRLKGQGLGALLNELHAHLEPPAKPDEEAPVRRCYRYRIQKRLKLPAVALWLVANAVNTLAFRVNPADRVG